MVLDSRKKTNDSELNVCHMLSTTKRQVMYKCHISFLPVRNPCKVRLKHLFGS